MPELAPVKPTLLELYLSDNQLVSFPVDYFQGFVRLLRLEVARNQLIAAPSVGWLASTWNSLEFLDLKENRITTLEGLTSKMPFERLRGLDLNENKIDKFDVGILGKMPKLRHLQIHGNDITQMDDYRRYFPHNPIVHTNPFHCDESMAWISTIKTTEWIYQRPTCATPWCLKDRDMLKISKYFPRNTNSTKWRVV